MSSVRAPAVAGLFYPGEAAALREAVDRLLGERPLPHFGGHRPRALIAPHAAAWLGALHLPLLDSAARGANAATPAMTISALAAIRSGSDTRSARARSICVVAQSRAATRSPP